MTGTSEPLAALPPLQRRMAEAWLSRFEESWHDQKLKECMRALPPQSSLRKPLLLAMIERDLAHNWRSGRPVSLTDYLKDFPELGTPDEIPIELIAAEYSVRQEHGRADLADFAERYPTRIDDLYVLLKPSLFDAAIPDKSELKKSVEDSVTAKRMKLLRQSARSEESDPVAERRRQLLRGDSAELPPTAVPSRTPTPADSFADIPGLQPTDSVEMFL
ncbi:MAG: hypothetical protein ACJ8F7_06095, partial [Gemmataceae bacterium]